MDYIVTDSQTSSLRLASQYSEKLAYMPNTFFIGDHKQMFPHLSERIILKDHNNKIKTHENGHVADNVAVINTINKVIILGFYNCLFTIVCLQLFVYNCLFTIACLHSNLFIYREPSWRRQTLNKSAKFQWLEKIKTWR
jgi:hypothetical protein